MIRCSQCGSNLEPSYRYCSRCGRPINARPLLEPAEIIPPSLQNTVPLAFENEINRLFRIMDKMISETLPRFSTLESQTIRKLSGPPYGEVRGFFFSYHFGGAPTERPTSPERRFRIPVK